MPVLVTGAAGLIASGITRKLVERGETVIALDRISPRCRLEDLLEDGKIKAVEADVTDRSAIEAAISENGVDRVIHTAAVLPPTSEEDPRNGCDVNIGGTNNIFDVASQHGVSRVVYPSSIAVYGDQSDHGDATLDEKSSCFPFSLYGVAKQANELAARAYKANAGLDCRGLRICTVFGHGRVTGRSAAASAMISAAAIGEAYVSKSKGSTNLRLYLRRRCGGMYDPTCLCRRFGTPHILRADPSRLARRDRGKGPPLSSRRGYFFRT